MWKNANMEIEIYVFSLQLYWELIFSSGPLSQQWFELLAPMRLLTSRLCSINWKSALHPPAVSSFCQAQPVGCALQLPISVQFLKTFRQEICAKGKRSSARKPIRGCRFGWKPSFSISSSVWADRPLYIVTWALRLDSRQRSGSGYFFLRPAF